MATPTQSRCDRFRQDLSSFVDHTLPHKRWEQVGYHVAGCESCRAEAAELRRVCDTLNTRTAVVSSATPANLAERLQGIAGESCDQPLYMAAGAHGQLPSKRRQRTQRATRYSAVAMATACALFVLCVLLAPEPFRVADPVAQARSDYGLGMTALSVNRTFGAVLLAHSRGAALSDPVGQRARATILTSAQPLPQRDALAMLDRSTADDLTYSGQQRVWIANGEGQFYVTDVSISQVSGMGVNLGVLDANGKLFSSWFVPTAASHLTGAPDSWEFRLYSGQDQVAGRWARLVEATDNGVPVSRWWLDSATGQLLWSERYDAFGAPAVIAGFTHLDFSQASLNVTNAELLFMHRAPNASPTPERSWCKGLDECPDDLAGLPLVGHASSRAYGITTMRLIYSDGFRNLSVQWIGGQWESEAVLRDSVKGLPDVAVWQASDGVVTVATNGGLELLHTAMGELPEPEPFELGLWDRAHAGLKRMLGIH